MCKNANITKINEIFTLQSEGYNISISDDTGEQVYQTTFQIAAFNAIKFAEVTILLKDTIMRMNNR